jgi:YfiH family protein
VAWVENDGVKSWREEVANATVVFGSRRRGQSVGSYASLNVGLGTGDHPASVASNRCRLSASVGVDPEKVVMARQVHADRIIEHEAPDPDTAWARGEVPDRDADGHMTKVAGLALAVITADCLPVAVVGKKGLGLVHCGWRGLAAGLAQKTSERVAGEIAVIGPGIGACCYEVGEDVRSCFAEYPETHADRHLDLASICRQQLLATGVQRVQSVDLCTCCEDEDFFSHRRDGEITGRQGTLAWLN